MQIVTDSGMDLSPEQVKAYNIHIVPHRITIGDRTYLSGVDLEPAALYRLLATTDALPVTAAPSPGDFATVYRRLAQTDPDILSIHMSSGLSAPLNVATAAREMVPEARITLVDTRTLSAVLGWMVVAAARAIQAGWPVERITALIQAIGDASDSVYTLDDLKYLIHGGRISHMKGLIASVLHLRPIIGVSKPEGLYEQRGVARTFPGALAGLVKQIQQRHPPGTALQVQLGHAENPAAVAQLRALIEPLYDCTWLPTCPMTPMMGAHTGPTMVGVAYAALKDLPALP
jgi:DegV family protein with EDD domain